MTEYYTVNEMYGEKFYQVPKVFFTNPLYKDNLTAIEKLAFGMLKDRFSLSVKNKWIDKQGRIYFIFTQKETMDIFDCSNKTASNIKKNLVKVGLLEVKKRGQGRADLLYLKKPIVTEDDIYKIKKTEDADAVKEVWDGEPRTFNPLDQPTEELIETVDAVETCKKYTAETCKKYTLEVKKVHGNDTDLSELDLNDINISSSSYSKNSIDNELKEKYPNAPFEQVKEELTNDETATINTDKQYKSMLEYRLKNWKPKKPNAPKQSKGKKPIRTEVLPDWFDADSEQLEKELPSVDQVAKKQELDAMLKKLRDNK